MWRFRGMGTDVTVAAPALDDDAERQLATGIASLFAETERRFSRFLATSELAALNRATAPVEVSPELFELLEAAGAHVVATDGVFDPAVGGALCAAGYDRSFAPGALDRDRPDLPEAAVARARFSELGLDTASRRVDRPAHVQIDLGGFLKGRTVDRAAASLAGASAAPAFVDAGGDAVLLGAGPDGEGWRVEVEDPDDAGRVLVGLRLRDRAVATSAANRRRWRVAGGVAHHLIDPRTGRPSRSDLAQVTVVAATAERADVLAKVVFLLGAEHGASWLTAQPGAAGVLAGRDGSLRVVGDLEVDHA